MNFTVRIPRVVQDKIKNWELDADTLKRLVLGLDSHLQKPTRKIGRNIVAPVRCFITHMDLMLPYSEIPATVTLWVNETREHGVREVLDASIRHPTPMA